MLAEKLRRWDEKENGEFSEDAVRFWFVKQRFSPSETRLSEPGAYYPPHRHPYDEYIVVLRGCLDVKIYGERFRISPGSFLFVPRLEMHEVVAVGNQTVESFDAMKLGWV